MDDSPNNGYRLAEMLGNPVRRGIVASLVGLSPPLDLDTVSDRVVEWLRKQGTEEQLVSNPDHVRLQLHHVHLPKLASAGLLQYDGQTKTVWDYSTKPLVTTQRTVAELVEEIESDGGNRASDQLEAPVYSGDGGENDGGIRDDGARTLHRDED